VENTLYQGIRHLVAVNIQMVLFCVLMLAVWNHINKPMNDGQLGFKAVLSVYVHLLGVPGERLCNVLFTLDSSIMCSHDYWWYYKSLLMRRVSNSNAGHM